MANPNKFVSVNLNKSYGQSTSSTSSSSAAFGNGRARFGAHSGSGGGGMVVLSRPRSSGQKSVPKLSVPPPLNLPSLRKEHERFDPSSVSGSSARPGSSGAGSGSSSSTMGWTKPGLSPAFQDKGGDFGGQTSSDQRVGSAYMPPGARSVGQTLPASPARVSSIEKAVVLRGEDFPSLMATFTSAQKQKDALNQKQKQKQLGEETSNLKEEKAESLSPLHMRPQMKSSRIATSNVTDGDRGLNHRLGAPEQLRKQDAYLPGPLPVVRLMHTSDWADDERDTGLSIPERDKDRGFSRMESVRAREVSDGRGHIDVEAGNVLSRDFFRGDSFGRNLATSNKDGRNVSSWRVSLQPRDGLSSRDTEVDRDRVRVRPFGPSREMSRESNYGQSSYGDSAQDGFSNGTQDSMYARRNSGYVPNVRNGRNVAEAFNGRGAEQNMHGRYGDQSHNRNGVNGFQSNTISRAPFSSGKKGFSLNDPILNFGREKHLLSSSGKPQYEDSGFDSRDPFSGEVIGDLSVRVFRRKKDMLKQADFHDPIRESFEAELERVQRLQEQERQRVVEEQERALELARKEEEERERVAREEEERRWQFEEEARQAAWRAEQERLEAVRKAEEQKIAREEEKRVTLMEEERRKEAARQKLLELEARIARRQAEANIKDDRFSSYIGVESAPVEMKEIDVPRVADVGDWEDGERMVEHITSSASSDSSSINRFPDTSRPHSSRDGNSSFVERGKHANYWKRDAYDFGHSSTFFLQEQENGYGSPRRDMFGSGRGIPRKEFHGGPGLMSGRPASKGGISEKSQMLDDFCHPRGDRWNINGEGDRFNRNSDVDVDAELLDNDKLGDAGWGPGRFHGSPHAPYAERMFQNSEFDGFSSFGRSRHSLRQPRVLPPPSMTSMHKRSFRDATEHPSSSFLDGETRYQHAGKTDEQSVQIGYESGYQEKCRQPGTTALLEANAICSEQKEGKNTPRCDSQSSLSVSSPPSSPTHISHDELDDSGDSPALPASADGERTVLPENEHVLLALEVENTNVITASGLISPGEDDEWVIENNEEMQEQEEYDEEDGYRGEDDVHEGDDENLDMAKEFDDLHSDVLNMTGEMDQLVVGFDEGIEVRFPSTDEFKKISKNSEKSAEVETGSVGATEELITKGENRLLVDNASPEGKVDHSSEIINETQKALQDLVLESVSSTSYPADSVEALNGSGIPAQQPGTARVNLSMPSTSSVQPIVSSVSIVAKQPEVPIKLQFGLFSGPSLIPSPVPAIQIGSIQMPLHLHPQVGSSLTQMHPSQPSFFQFGQLRYTSPVSQGILPLAPQTMPFVQAPPAHYSLNQNPRDSLYNQAGQGLSNQNISGGQIRSFLKDNQSGLEPKPFDLSRKNLDCKELNVLPDLSKNEALASPSQTDRSSFGENITRFNLASQAESLGTHDVTVKKNTMASSKESLPQLHAEPISSQFLSGGKALNGSKASSLVSGSRGKRFAYTLRNNGSRASFSVSENSRTNSSGFQGRPRRNIRRTEFRVRENVDRRQTYGIESFSYARYDVKPNLTGRMSGVSARSGVQKDTVLNKSTKMMIESEHMSSVVPSSRAVISDSKMDRAPGKQALSKRRISSVENSHAGGNLKRNGNSEEDVDAPLQSGVVQVFKQPGIEALSDEDDFIEVRSKRQMLNDRREQREKENKAKSRVIKAPRKHHAIPQRNAVISTSNRVLPSLGGDSTNNILSDPVVTDGRAVAIVEPSSVFTANRTSQTLSPIGTPAVNVDSDMRSISLKFSQTSPVPVIPSGGMKLVPGASLENKNIALDNGSTPLGSWRNAHINQQVMALTQTQLDEAMKPAQLDSHVDSSIALQHSMPSTSVMMQEKIFSSSASPLNCLLAGEKIQFGAVTSPTILPPVSRAISNGIGPPGSCRSDVSVDRNLPVIENGRAVFFDKDKRPDESCGHLEDPEAEAEAEAAASAVAVAAITNDEIVGNGLGSCSVSLSETKNFGGADVNLLTSGGMTTILEVTGQSAGEESLTVALPADLSVDTPSLSLWPPMPSPQRSGPMLSHFPGGPPSHFPCFEMNPMLGAPIFAFGPHDESAGTQAQPKRSTTLGSGPLGAWPSCHSGMESFYGSPTGFTGPFISPPGGIPGVQGPPHMFVYNHFTPVGQFGQVGLGFMGTTYIPTGKQPDWNHNPVSPAVGVGEGDNNNLNVVSGQRNPPGVPAIQHMAPGSPIMPLASPLAMFDMSPFQSVADMPVQACWSHLPSPPVHSVPLSVPLQQHQVEGGMLSQFSHPMGTSTVNSRFHEPRPAEGSRNISGPVASSQFPDELGLVEPPTASGNNNKGSNGSKPAAKSTESNASESMGPSFKSQAAQQLTSSGGQQYLHPTGYADQRGGGASQKMGAGGEWHRRMGFNGRNQISGADKNFASSKMKQIYVAKPTTSGPATTG